MGMRRWIAIAALGSLLSWGATGAQAAAAWTDALVVEVPVTHAEARPQTSVAFPISVENQGGAPTRLTWEVAFAHPRLLVVEPVPLTIGAAGTRHAKASIPIAVQTPYENGQIDENGTFILRLTPSSEDDPSLVGEPRHLTFSVHTKGAYVPASALAWIGAALAAAALMRRDRR